jgi:hypothetical protein
VTTWNGVAMVSLGAAAEAEEDLAFTTLGDDELRRWELHCRGLEGGGGYPWVVRESRALMDSVLACLFGEDLLQLDTPASAWARTNTTMSIFTRRLGCLRELISEESLIDGPGSSQRVQEIFDRVTIVGTESALATLVNADETADLLPRLVGEPRGDRGDEAAQSNRRRRFLLGLLALALVLVVAGVAFALSSSPTRHPTGGTRSGSTVSSGAGATTKTGRPHSSGSPSTNSTTSAKGPTARPSSGGAAHGSSGSSQSGTAGLSGTGTAGNSGTSGTNPSGTGSGSKDSGTTITLPRGGAVTLPTVTIPGGTQLTTPVTVPTQRVQIPGGTTVTTPTVTIPSL